MALFFLLLQEGWSALMIAAYVNHRDIVKSLIDHGAAVMITSKVH